MNSHRAATHDYSQSSSSLCGLRVHDLRVRRHHSGMQRRTGLDGKDHCTRGYFKDTEFPAAQVHASALAAVNGNYARVLSTDELLAELR